MTILGLYQLHRYLQKLIETPKFNYIFQRQVRRILGEEVAIKNFKLINKHITAVDYRAIAIGMVEVAILSILDLVALINNASPLFFL